MSVTVSALPFFLLFAVGKGIVETINISNSLKNEIDLSSSDTIHFENNIIEKLFNKEFETNITNMETLLKTLKEHGAKNVRQKINQCSCDCENFHLEFYKRDEPFFYLTVEYKKENGMSELLENLDSEYKINAQEVSYNKIKERLEKQNLKIDEEEIYDDNTIVLTVNLE